MDNNMEKNAENNNENNGGHPDPDPIVLQLQQQLATMQRQLNEQIERPVVIHVQNMFAYREVANPPVGNNQNATNNFELKPGLLNMAAANAFGGSNTEDANKHLTKFIQISNTVKANGVIDEQVRLRLFPFSLKDDAKDWFDSMGSNSVRT